MPGLFCQHGKAALADEEGLIHPDRPRRIDLQAIGDAIGILADDEMALLETQHALGLDAKGFDAPCRSRRKQYAPQVQRMFGGHMYLVAQLANKADAHQPARHAGDAPVAQPEIRERSITKIDISEPLEHRARQWPGEVERCMVSGEIDQPHRQAPPGRESGELAKQRGRVGRGGREIECLGSTPADHAVVDDHSGLVEHQPVARSAGLQVREPRAVDAVEELTRVHAMGLDLAERADIDQPDGRAHCGYFGCDRLFA